MNDRSSFPGRRDPMRNTMVLGVIAVVAFFALAACGGDDDGGGEETGVGGYGGSSGGSAGAGGVKVAAHAGTGGGLSSGGSSAGGGTAMDDTHGCTRDAAHDATCSAFWSKLGESLPRAWTCPEAGPGPLEPGVCSSTSSGKEQWTGWCCPGN
jgi:hypothetical protein